MKKKRTSVIWLTAVLVITVIAWVVYSLAVNSQLPFMDFLMVASAIVGSFGVMLEGTPDEVYNDTMSILEKAAAFDYYKHR